jgi:hypothetical protein
MRTQSKWAWGAALAMLAACGGKAIVDGKQPTGSGGSGGATSTSVTSAGGTVTTSAPDGPGPMTATAVAVTNAVGSTGFTGSATAVTSTGSGPMSACPSECMYIGQCSFQPACVMSCLSVKPECVALHENWLDCLMKNQMGTTCAAVPACKGALDAYLMCAGPVQNGGCGADSNGNCTCSDAVGNHKYTSQCSPAGMGQFSCSCSIDGMPIGKCFGPGGPMSACIVDTSCCANLYFVPN